MAAESESMAVTVARGREAPAWSLADPIAKLNQICKAIALGVVITIGATALYFQFYSARFTGLIGRAGIDQAQLAAHIARGEGMTTDVVTPLGLRLVPSVASHPDLMSAPLYPHALAVAFRLRHVSDGVVAVSNGLIYLLTVWALYVLAKVLYGKPAAILTAVLYATSIEALDRGLRGGPVSLAGLMLTLTFLALFLVIRREWTGPDASARGEQRGRSTSLWRWVGVVGAAVLLAITYLCDCVSLLLVVPLAAALWFGLRSRKTTAAIVFLVVAVACLAPWFYRNYQCTRTLLPALQTRELVSRTQAYPGTAVFREASDAVPDPVEFAIAHPAQMAVKVVTGFTRMYRQLPLFISIYLFPFVVVGAFWAKRSRETRVLWRAAIAVGVIQLLAACLYDLDVTSVLVLAPVATCLGTGAFVELMSATVRSRSARAWLTALLIAVCAFPYAASISLAGKEPPHPSYANLAWLRLARYPEGHPAAGHLVIPADAVIATNVPHAVAWYTRRTAVWLPPDEEGLQNLQANGAPIDYVYLSRAGMGDPQQEEPPDRWTAMLLRPNLNEITKLGSPMPLPGPELLIALKKP